MIWGTWLGAIALSFGVLEAYCLYTEQDTLSQFTRNTLTNMWPGLAFGFGVAVTLLAVHFWGQVKS